MQRFLIVILTMADDSWHRLKQISFQYVFTYSYSPCL